MKKFRLLGVLCIFIIALVSASANSINPLVSNLLNTVFIISCGVIGLWLLRKTNLSETLKVRQRVSRRFVNLEINRMKERRKIQDRREKEPSQGLPGYYARCIPDRRNNNTSKVDTNR